MLKSPDIEYDESCEIIIVGAGVFGMILAKLLNDSGLNSGAGNF